MTRDRRTLCSNLVVEVTRRCNMECRHCLRGPAEPRDMGFEMIDSILDQVTFSSIAFTGGEPSLASNVIKYFVDRIIYRKIDVDGFYIVTNAKVYSEEMVDSLISLYGHMVMIRTLEDAYCGLAVSEDPFHEQCDMVAQSKYKALVFYRPYDKVNIEGEHLIEEGNAIEWGLGDSMAQDQYSMNTFTDQEVNVDVLYISAIGDVMFGCDYSYESQKEQSVGNMNDEPIFDIVHRAIKVKEDSKK